MSDNRIKSHPILSTDYRVNVPIFWQGEKYLARPDEMISSALLANGFSIFSHHPKDGSAQGIYCANGQCSQCLVLADGLPVKACMTSVKAGMRLEPLSGLQALPDQPSPSFKGEASEINYEETEVLILGGGPAGLSAAVELGKLGVRVILIDDKDRLGGKLVLQTHRFFGSSEAVYAGSRGIEIAKRLEADARAQDSVDIWLKSTAVGVFEDKVVGILRGDNAYWLVKPKVLLVATGAREKTLAFHGNTLPGVYGAGAFQTLVNRDLVKPCKNLFIVGGGNVGLIAGYHAIQAGIHVSGLVEAAPQCGGYKVHLDKLKRSGVPVYTSATVLEARGKDAIEKVVIANVDQNFQPIPGTEKEYPCDTLLIAVGLDPVNEFLKKAEEIGMQVFSAGDAHEIAEASAAIFSGKIAGNQIATLLGKRSDPIPTEWKEFEEILKSRPGPTKSLEPVSTQEGLFPVLHCNQEIPCDPCSTVCPRKLILIDRSDIRHTPQFTGTAAQTCIGCTKCVAVCPGLAISLVDFRKGKETALVTLPYEQDPAKLVKGEAMLGTDIDGNVMGEFTLKATRSLPGFGGTTLVTLEVPRSLASEVSGVKLLSAALPDPFDESIDFSKLADGTIICRCERVTAGEIRALIRAGVRDVNQIKSVARLSMGACGGKTCLSLVKRVFQSEGVSLAEVTETRVRPVFVEIPLGVLAGIGETASNGRSK